ncbi:MAG: four helix bundle protein [Bacteroidales bacterium]|nr:four helix bundle protein [Bacteroidales bacterium]
MRNFEDLELYRECRKFRKDVSILVKSFPKDEKYRLTDQLLRCSRSITANIAEGHGRYHYQENIQFCRQARGSLCESLDHLICALDEKYINDTQLNDFRKAYDQCLKLLNGYILYLKKRINS